ncbi:MAG: tRNA 2-thiocytidine(32) synthetase TtcA, partial [Defluviitaleaceae bacterium]|nr:tRNA 2-thiocytidine(32) synthetase TtcA [Defluviitaleaceae bacterium]
MTLQNIMGHVRRACDDYKMIVPGCKILVGVSGGKDSLTLLAALAAMRRFYEPSYSLAAATVDLGFKEFDASGVAAYCKNLNVPFELIKTDIADVVFNVRKEKNPCALCSKMRKGALNDHAKKIFAGRVAYGHNRDDVLHTFFLSLFYEGRIHTCAPVTYLSRTDLHVV